MDVIEAINTKRAVRTFSKQPISEEAARAILNAGRKAQSSKNSQPWYFILIRDRATLAELAKCGAYARHLEGAELAVALITEQAEGFDLGQAAAYMQLAAWDLGIGSCLAAMWEPEKAKTILGIPQELVFNYAISFGYPEPGQERPAKAGGRKSFEEIVFMEKWQG